MGNSEYESNVPPRATELIVDPHCAALTAKGGTPRLAQYPIPLSQPLVFFSAASHS